jgi:murein DD-endopeptidase MepM/ murein hydrolase activator NlpD
MAVTGKFDADFGDFKTEVDESTARLKAMEVQADAVGAAVDKALAPKGGGGSALDAVSGALGNINAAATTTTTALGGLAAANETVAASGMTVVSTAEMEAAGFLTLQGQTAATITEVVSAAGAVELLGSAFIGWKIGRAVSDMFDLDNVIGKATASLLGMGNVAKETAGAVGDTLAKASDAAGYSVTNLSEAVNILTEKNLERLKTTLQGTATAASDRAFYEWAKQIEQLTQAGVIPQLTKDLDSQAFTVKELAGRYGGAGLTGAIQEYARELAKQRATEKAADTEHADFLKEVQQILKDQDAEKNKQETLDAKVRELERNHISTMSAGLLGLSRQEQESSQKDMEATVKQIIAHEKLVATLKEEVTAATALNTARTMGPTTPDAAGDAASRRDAALGRIAEQQKKAPEVDLTQLIVDAWFKFDEQVGARAPLAGGGGGTSPTVNMNVSGVFDMTTVRQMTDAISAELMRRTGADRYLPAR